MSDILGRDTLPNVLAVRAGKVEGSTLSWAYTEDGYAGQGSEGAAKASQFQIGSVTKAFTATLLSLLVHRTVVRLDDPIGKYLPDTVSMPAVTGGITLQELATHTSGLPRVPPHLCSDPHDDPYAGFDVPALYSCLESLQPETLTESRGSFQYSNLGVGLLGHVLSLITGTPFAKLLEAEVFQPFGMHESFLLETNDIVPSELNGFTAMGKKKRPWRFGVLAPCGAAVSSVADLMRFTHVAMEDFGELGVAARFAMKPVFKMHAGSEVGLCWLAQGSLRWHNGMTASHSATLAIDVKNKRAMVALWNAAASLDDICFAFLDPELLWLVPSELGRTECELEKFAGVFESAAGRIAVVTSGRGLVVKSAITADIALTPCGPDAFFSRDPELTLAFEFSEDGTADAMRLDLCGLPVVRATRLVSSED